MTAKQLAGVLVGSLTAALLLTPSADVNAQATTQTLTSVRVPRAVMADGKPLAAGTYSLRLAGEQGTPVVGQTPDEWVEFVQGGQVRGRELASVVASDAIGEIAEGTPPASGRAKVEMLRSNEYLRIWVNRGGTHYLIHLPVSAE